MDILRAANMVIYDSLSDKLSSVVIIGYFPTFCRAICAAQDSRLASLARSSRTAKVACVGGLFARLVVVWSAAVWQRIGRYG